ncbi:NAD-dependent epimerase/dehydratase family protein [Paenibacillus protaetiae]|uniref:NAD(P)-dependent oxidoreductase n=1 Tax=Paenibacillus protaetiae TaxID=2509456 RepID=A0A4P6F1V8_9BACL|nr:NAD(P)-dependent oxidoreductase [Paenibacillus protaetiae]QAY68119.1 NAD(P)-dependent oxidoreductase [Paenibacillus protaetiae]
MNTILVTGSEGKLGRFVVNDLAEAGYRVIGTDNRPAQGGRRYSRYVQANLTDLGEVYGIAAEADAIVHLAAVPNPINFSPERIFHNNMMSTYNVMEAASKLGIKRVVAGSSESAYGFCWAKHPFAPDYLPVDEAHPLLPQESYGLSKGLNELTGDMFARRTGMELFMLRFSLIVAPEEYEREIGYFADTARHHRILWSYVDARDAASACRLALTAPLPRADEACRLGITASDLLSGTDLQSLAAQYYPQLPLPEKTPGALVSNKRAGEVLNWHPAYSWRDAASAK